MAFRELQDAPYPGGPDTLEETPSVSSPGWQRFAVLLRGGGCATLERFSGICARACDADGRSLL